MNSRKCPYCETPLSADASFCPACGAKLEQRAVGKAPQTLFCANCGRALSAGVQFCSGCGARVGGQQTPPGAPAAAYPPQQPPQQYAPPFPQQPYPRQQGPQWQQPNVRQRQQPYVQAPAPKKRKPAVPIIALVLVAAILFTGLVRPGFFVKNRRAEALINRVQVHIPNPTGPEAVVRLTGDIALQYYIQARLYLEKLSQYDLSRLDAEEFGKLVLNTLTALDDALKISDCLSDAVDLWMECDDVREAPTYKVVQTAKGASSGLFAMKAFAAEPSPSEIKAQDIISAFDKAKNGQKIKAVAELLGTDVKHAAVQLKMALAGDEKLAYDKIAEKADTCVKVAKTLKTAGTVAGVVIAAAPIATGAVAAMTAGEVLVTGAGVVVSTVNAGLEVTSTGAMLYHGTDDNEVTQIADAIADSKFMQTVNLVTSVAGVGYNVKNAFNELEKLAKGGAGAKEIMNYLGTLNKGNTPQDMYGLLSFGLSNPDLLPGPGGMLASVGLKSLITVMTHTGENGLDINISDTPLEDAKKNEAAIDRLLDELGIKDAGARGMLDQAVGLYRGETADDGLPTDPAEPASPKLVDDLLTAYTYISPDGGTADLDRTMELAKAFLGELSMYKLVPVSESPTPESAPPESAPPEASPTGTPAQPTATPTPASAPTPTPAGPSSPGSSLTMEDIAGHYSLTGTQTDYLDGKPEVESSRLSCYIEIDGQGRLLYVTGYGEYRTEVVLNRDAGADTWRYEDPWADWFTEYGTLTFHRESGGIRLDLVIEQIDNTQKDVESRWDLSGMKD